MSDVPSELDQLRAELAATKAELVQVRADVSSSVALISAVKLEIAKLRRELYGASPERSARLIDRLELQLEELVAAATEDEITATKAAETATSISSFERRRRPPAPFHLTQRECAGPNLLAMVLFEKFAQYLPLNRQAGRYAREGGDLSLSTLADQVGACVVALQPIHALIKAHVMAAERLHGDDTSVPLLAWGGTTIARFWTYVRGDRPFGGSAPPAALFHFSRDQVNEHSNRHLAG